MEGLNHDVEEDMLELVVVVVETKLEEMVEVELMEEEDM